MSKEEIQKEIDCVIEERSSRWYMKATAEEFINRIFKVTKDSSVSMSYNDINNRYKDARYENNVIIEKLKNSRDNIDLSLITEKNGFDTRDNNNYLFLCCDEPFMISESIDEVFSDSDSLIKYLYTINNNSIIYYNGIDYVYGIDEILESKIREFFNDNEDIIIEFG